MKLYRAPIDPDRIDAVLAEVARRWDVTEEELRGRTRLRHIIPARHSGWWALSRLGLNTAEIGRHVGFDHSTIVHGLAHAERHPEWQKLVASAVELAGVGGQRVAVRRWLESTLPGSLPPAQRAAVQRYVLGMLGLERHRASDCAAGMLLVLHRPAIRRAVVQSLTACDLGAHVARIDLHAQQLRRA